MQHVGKNVFYVYLNVRRLAVAAYRVSSSSVYAVRAVVAVVEAFPPSQHAGTLAAAVRALGPVLTAERGLYRDRSAQPAYTGRRATLACVYTAAACAQVLRSSPSWSSRAYAKHTTCRDPSAAAAARRNS